MNFVMTIHVNQGVVGDTAKLIMHRLIARQIRRDPALVANSSGTVIDFVATVPDCITDHQLHMRRSFQRRGGYAGLSALMVT